ncbi:MAG: glyoxalase [Nitrospiraceae bacterium]|nr:glyoxalase [Nitrospiraceae bacterium]|tara:strand:+ start:4212 stop:4643 length:432 start_codon:yes stop_codon:yes gene_type:complete
MAENTVKQSPHSLGIRHLALRVGDIQQSKAFYLRVFGMYPVWEPDPLNSYLSSGADNLALHQIAEHPTIYPQPSSTSLDHFGFLMENPEAVDEMLRWIEQCEIPITKAPKTHRDGSYSFYIADPDGNTIQVLYEPNIKGPPSA